MPQTFTDRHGVVHRTFTVKRAVLKKRAHYLLCTNEDLFHLRMGKGDKVITCLQCLTAQ
jgi:hypothetical protein